MPNAYTDTSSTSLGGTSGGAGLVQKAYDRLLEFALRSEPLIRSVADKRPARQAFPGSTVVLQKYVDLAQATTALTETTDPDAVSLSTPTSVTITLSEYGNAVLVTRALELFSLADVDPAVANIIAYNLADSIDAVAMTTLRSGTNNIFAGDATSVATVDATDTIDSADIRKSVARLRGNKAKARRGSLYWTGIHPSVSHDLRAETGTGGWRQPHEYVDTTGIYAGELGTYEGVAFVETPRLTNTQSGSGAGAAQVRVYNTFIMGQQALAEAVAEEPHTVIGPVTDKLMRLRPLGWYGVLGHALYRTEALWRIETASSVRPTV